MTALAALNKVETIGDQTYHWNLQQGTDAWLQARLGIITASQMKLLITQTGKVADNNDSRAIVYQKVSERISNEIEESFSNHHMERGKTYEPFARDLYDSEIAKVQECGFITRQFDGFKIGYSPDGLVGDDGLIEIKCPTQHKHVKEICENKEPKEHMMQIQTGLLVTERKWCDFVSYYNGMALRVVRVYPDLELHATITGAVKILEENIQKNLEIYNQYAADMPHAKYIEGEAV